MTEPAQLRWHGRMVEWTTLSSCASTQDEARRLLGESAAPIAVQIVCAREQTAGRGRQGRMWESPAGVGIYLSIAIGGGLSSVASEQWPRRIVEAVVAVLERETGVRAQVREPNDIYVGGRKLGGVLIDAGSEGDDASSFRHVITGIGINVAGPRTDVDGRATTTIAAEQVVGSGGTTPVELEPLARAIAHAGLGVLVDRG